MRKNRGGGRKSLPIAEWKRRVQALRDSGLTLTAFCRREKMSRNDLQHWRLQFEGINQPVAGRGKRGGSLKCGRPSFAEVRVQAEATVPAVESSTPSPYRVSILLSSGDRLFLPEACDPRWLGQVVRALRSGRC